MNLLFGLEYVAIFVVIPIVLLVIGTLIFAAIAEKMHLSASTLWAFFAVLAISIFSR